MEKLEKWLSGLVDKDLVKLAADAEDHDWLETVGRPYMQYEQLTVEAKQILEGAPSLAKGLHQALRLIEELAKELHQTEVVNCSYHHRNSPCQFCKRELEIGISEAMERAGIDLGA